MGGWFIWWEHRKLVHGEPVQQVARSVLSIASLMTNYKNSMQKTVRQRKKWKRPLEGKLLLNIDGSFREVKGIGGTGAIIRDCNGSSIAGSCSYSEHVADASISDAAASSFIWTVQRLWRP